MKSAAVGLVVLLALSTATISVATSVRGHELHEHDDVLSHPHVHRHRHLAEQALNGQAVHMHGSTCGYGHPYAEAHLGSDDDAIVDKSVKYHSLDHPTVARMLKEADADLVDTLMDPEVGNKHLRRRLQAMYNTENNDGSTFLPLSAANQLGLTAGIRIKVIWEVVEGSDYSGSRAGGNALQCTRVGGSIKVPCQSGAANCYQSWNECDALDVIAAGSGKLAGMKTRVNEAMAYFNKALKVKPVLTPITIAPAIVNDFGLTTTTVSDADLVIIFTARPSPWVALNGYASCRQRDAHGRCIVGAFNWVPRVFSGGNKRATKSAELHTALHELIHVLGGMNPNRVFIDENGLNRNSGVYINSVDGEDYPKPSMKLVTPKVLAMVREHFACSDMEGMPLEDQPTGRAAHWEARIMGPEVMSYGTGTGETYMGDITFAFLEDTNQYIANYTMAGPLVPVSPDAGKSEKPFDIEILPADDFEPLVKYSPGALRWGRGMGCDFVSKSARLWSAQYTCAKSREFACSFDNKMSSVCVVQPNWALSTDRKFTCGTCSREGLFTCSAPSCTTTPNDNCDAANGCKLPSMYQYFDATTAAVATGAAGADPARTGGFSSAMDYAPLRLGYWDCQDTNSNSNGSALLGAESGGSTDLGSVTNGAEDNMKLFGGQSYGYDARCFVSSLMDFTSGNINPNFPRFGLCYRANCYREDYLQFAIEGQLGDTTWYKCPTDGGKLYIAGFSGAFHCPKAVNFCQFETITGIKYKETNPLWEWIMYATMTGLPSLILISCVVFPCFRHWATGRGKKWCGVNHFNRRGEVDHDSEVDHDEVAHKPPKVPSTVLLGTNVLTLLVGLMMAGGAAYAIANGRVSNAGPLIISVSFTTISFATLGAVGAVKESRGISCVIVAFFYATFGSMMMFLFLMMFAVIFPDSLNSFLESHWDTLVDATPKDFIPKNVEPGDHIQVLKDNMVAIVVGCLFAFIFFIVNLTMSVWIITLPVLAATMMTISCYAFMFMGCMVVAGGAYVTVFHSGLGSDVNVIISLFVCFGIYTIASAIVGLVAAFTKARNLLLWSLLLENLTFACFCAGAVMLFKASNSLETEFNSLTDEQLQSLTQNLGMMGMSRQQVSDKMRDNLRQVGLMGVVSMMVLVCQIIANGYFLYRVKKHHKRLNSKRLQVAPYAKNKNALNPDGTPVLRSHGSGRHASGEHVRRHRHRHHRHHSHHHGPPPHGHEEGREQLY